MSAIDVAPLPPGLPDRFVRVLERRAASALARRRSGSTPRQVRFVQRLAELLSGDAADREERWLELAELLNANWGSARQPLPAWAWIAEWLSDTAMLAGAISGDLRRRESMADYPLTDEAVEAAIEAAQLQHGRAELEHGAGQRLATFSLGAYLLFVEHPDARGRWRQVSWEELDDLELEREEDQLAAEREAAQADDPLTAARAAQADAIRAYLAQLQQQLGTPTYMAPEPEPVAQVVTAASLLDLINDDSTVEDWQ